MVRVGRRAFLSAALGVLWAGPAKAETPPADPPSGLPPDGFAPDRGEGLLFEVTER